MVIKHGWLENSPIKTSIEFGGFSIAMFDYRRLSRISGPGQVLDRFIPGLIEFMWYVNVCNSYMSNDMLRILPCFSQKKIIIPFLAGGPCSTPKLAFKKVFKNVV